MSDAETALREILARRKEPLDDAGREALWRDLVAGPLGTPGAVPFERHWELWRRVAARAPGAPPAPAYLPDPRRLEQANVAALARAAGVGLDDLQRWSATDRDAFWTLVLRELGIPFREPAKAIRAGGAESPAWLPGARINIVDACFRADPAKVALLLGREGDDALRRVTYAELERLVDRVAHGLAGLGLRRGDAIALYLPMTLECVAAYLGAIRAGLVVVSIADSFAPPEVATRLRIGQAKAIVTTGAFARGGKTIDLYAKVVEADAPSAIVVPGPQAPALRKGDLLWEEMLGDDAPFEGVAADPYDATNVLFSSGTTGEPKAIPWTHLTPIKAAMDGRYHQDVRPDDVVCWPTSIGWMMGPWLLYAGLVNQASVALYEGAPNGAGFPAFVKRAGVTILGVVPALVRAWRGSGVVRDELAGVRVLSSTGEASNVEDQLWLMSTTGYRAPVIEYCGGTEVGGGHVTGLVTQPQSPATFSTPALGLGFVVLGEDGKPVPVGGMGELWIVPPSIGLSERLLNRDHHKEYYADAPLGPDGETLRRHGDEVQRLGGGHWQAHGRADDTMNLGGIKVSSIELERAMDRHPDVYQTAAVAVVPPEGGAERLVVFVVPRPGAAADAKVLHKGLQDVLRRDLNPLYRVHDVVLVDALPRTASNKIMRRELRKGYRPSAPQA